MISRDELPGDAADWSDVRITFEQLTDNSAASCPVGEANVFRYVLSESGDGDMAIPSRLAFIRTAKVQADHYWAWRYVELDGGACYVTFCVRPDGLCSLSLAAANGLSIEQFLLADHYKEIYWA